MWIKGNDMFLVEDNKMSKTLDKLAHSYLFLTLIAALFLSSWFLKNQIYTVSITAIAVFFILILSNDGMMFGTVLLFGMFSIPYFMLFDTIPWDLYAQVGILVGGLFFFLIKKIIRKEARFSLGAIGLSMILLTLALFAAQIKRHLSPAIPVVEEFKDMYIFYGYFACGIFGLITLIYLMFRMTSTSSNTELIHRTFYLVNLIIVIELLYIMISTNEGANFDFNLTGWGSKNVCAIALEVCLPFLAVVYAKNRFRIDAIALIALNLYFIVISDSRGGTISIFLLLPLLLYIMVGHEKNRKFIYPIVLTSSLVAMFICYLFIPSIKISIDRLVEMGNQLSGREEIWEAGLNYFRNDIMFGGGVTSLFELSDVFGFPSVEGQAEIWFLHNTVITILCASGLVGIIAFTYHIIELFIANYKAKTYLRSALLYFILIGLIHGIIDNTFFNVIYLLPYIWIFGFKDFDSIKYSNIKYIFTRKEKAYMVGLNSKK